MFIAFYGSVMATMQLALAQHEPHRSLERSARRASRCDVTYRPGSDEDFVRLYSNSYTKILRTLIIRLGDTAAAEDCAQEAFERAYRNWQTWKPVAPAEAWVHRIAVNAAISYQRKQRLREVDEVVRRLGPPRLVSEPEYVVELGYVWDALKSLTPKQATALLLRHYHGYTNRAVSAYLGVPERTFASRLAAARAKMRLRLGRAAAG